MANNQERRKSPRIDKHLVIAYQQEGSEEKYDLSQVKDISKGGLHFMTTQKFSPGTTLTVELRTPITSGIIKIKGKVIDSIIVIKDLLNDTRLEFIELDSDTEILIDKTIMYFNKNYKENY